MNQHNLKMVLSLAFVFVIIFPSQAQVWTLQQCIDTAQVYNKNLQIGRNNIVLGEQKQKEAKANLNPKVNLAADYKYFFDLPYQLMPESAFGGPEGLYKETQFGVPHNIGINIQAAVPLYNSQIYGAIKTTKIASEMSELQYKKTEEQLFFEISNLYFNAQILEHQLIFIDSNLMNTSKLLKNMQLLHDQLMAKGTDVNKIQLQKDQLLTQHELVASNLEQVMNALKFAMGLQYNEILVIEKDIQYQIEKEYLNLPIVDLQLANTQNKLLASELKTLKNSRLPSASLYGSYGQTGFGYDEKPNDFLKFFPTSFAGVQISYSLFNGMLTKRKISQKKLEIQNSELQISLVDEQNTMLIQNAKRRRLVALSSIKDNSSQINLASDIYQQSVIQQKEGTSNLTDVLMADNALREAQQMYLAAVIDYLKADLELKKLTGNISSKN